MIEYRDRTNSGPHVIMTKCPACGKRFERGSGRERQRHFLHDHTIEDFGL